ncbi:MAG: Asp-tRNA(Asn)/Glu-tRNA(Gln) amidotransferase subunit GatA [Actinobacteria bacterium]|nr:Asp-tRNA(Asn)/Glu-tRNA(Gln) amidotransferase subunit GatA [Actinomycetota bacterium]MCG2807454.1 Asp-tRNA(Asn)/Glu-tRNA(Gln) amidotransferase subunit GatA [Coriobacteriia bacterium]
MSEFDVSRLTGAHIREGVVTGQFTAREVAEATLARVEALEPTVHAFNQVTPELALEAADAVDSSRAQAIADGLDPRDVLGALAGVPAGIKDNMNLVGTRTTCSAKILENYESVYDCTAVRRLLDAGAVPIGKCNMDEFAFGSSTENSAFGPTHNPWDLERVPGGSSGGSAACVSASMATISLGSDTGGSIRQPGALTGTVAVKPTYGRVSRYGCVAFGSSLDQIGPFARTVEDSAAALAAIAGADPMDATSAQQAVPNYVRAAAEGATGGAKGLRVGIVTDLLQADGCSGEVRAAVENAARIYADLGAEVGEVTLPASAHGLSAYYIIGPAEASSNLARFDGIRYGHRVEDPTDVLDLYMRSRAEGFGPESIRRIMLGTYALSAGYYEAYYGQAQKARTLIKQDFESAFKDFDVLLTPTSPTVAFKIGEKSADPLEMYLSDVYTIPVNLAGIPAISVPAGLCPSSGLPIGLQIMADYFAEETMFMAAAAFEAAIEFDARPPLRYESARGTRAAQEERR